MTRLSSELGPAASRRFPIRLLSHCVNIECGPPKSIIINYSTTTGRYPVISVSRYHLWERPRIIKNSIQFWMPKLDFRLHIDFDTDNVIWYIRGAYGIISEFICIGRPSLTFDTMSIDISIDSMISSGLQRKHHIKNIIDLDRHSGRHSLVAWERRTQWLAIIYLNHKPVCRFDTQ